MSAVQIEQEKKAMDLVVAIAKLSDEDQKAIIEHIKSGKDPEDFAWPARSLRAA